jgi:hypothetical protein
MSKMDELYDLATGDLRTDRMLQGNRVVEIEGAEDHFEKSRAELMDILARRELQVEELLDELQRAEGRIKELEEKYEH